MSLYNDNIFSREEIAAFPGLVNIHPALANLRGRDYDTLPNLEAHRDDGATLHVVDEDIDSGRVIKVISRPMPQAVADPVFRRMTQRLSLELLETLMQRGRRTDPGTLAAELRHQAHQAGLPWNGERLTSRQLTAFRHNASRHQPRHPLFALLSHQRGTERASQVCSAWRISAAIPVARLAVRHQAGQQDQPAVVHPAGWATAAQRSSEDHRR